MILRKLWVYLSILVVVAGIWAAMEFFFPKKSGDIKNQALFPGISSAKIVEIQWRRGAEVIHLKKEGSWKIIQPISGPADSKVVEGILQTLTTLRWERKWSDPKQDLKEFGLDIPRVKILFLTQGKWFELQVGNKTAVGDNCYIKIFNSSDLFLIEEHSVRELDRDLSALNEKKIKEGP